MASKYIFLFLLFIIIAGINIVPINCSYTNELNMEVFIKDINLESMESNVRIHSYLTTNSTYIYIYSNIRNEWHIKSSNQTLYGNGYIMPLNGTSNFISNNVTYTNYFNMTDLKFRFFGDKGLYPYDSYMLNFTINFIGYTPAINSTNINVYTWPSGWTSRNFHPSVIISKYKDYSELNFKIYLDRTSWEVQFFNLFYSILLILLSMLYLINIIKYIGKLTIYFTYFIGTTNLILYFTPFIPQKTSSLILILFYILIIGIFYYLISDIIILYLHENFKKVMDEYKFTSKLINIIAVIFTSCLGFFALLNITQAYSYYDWIIFPQNFLLQIPFYLVISVVIDIFILWFKKRLFKKISSDYVV